MSIGTESGHARIVFVAFMLPNIVVTVIAGNAVNSVSCERWLEWGFRGAEARVIRLQLQLARLPSGDPSFWELLDSLNKALPSVSPSFRALVATAPIEGCPIRLEVTCPKRWDELTPTARDKVRFCSGCHKDVTFVSTQAEADAVAREGGCLSIDPVMASGSPLRASKA